MAKPLGPVDYRAGAPATYHCAGCGAHDCKLWRQYNVFASHIRLLCLDCAGRDQKLDLIYDDDGRVLTTDGSRTDQIGSLIPAVPTEDGRTFWGYTSVPGAGVRWWQRLSTKGAPRG